MDTVTVTCHRKRYRLSFSKLPGRTFGPYDLRDAVTQLYVGALLERIDARTLVLDAAMNGTATTEVG